MSTQTLSDLLGSAASILDGRSAVEGPALDLLKRLDYLDDAADAAPHRATLLRAAAGFRRIFTVRADDAPGLIALGAEVDAGCLGVANAPVGGVSGTGLQFRQAFEACVGEGAEYISGFATQADTIVALDTVDALAEATPAMQALWARLQPCRHDRQAAQTDWVAAASLSNGAPAWLPADLCLRRPAASRDLDPPWPLSTGCGAGLDALAATLHGLLELIERDAVTLWLRGGARPRVVPPGPGADRLAQLRGSATRRHNWLLDITSDIGVPVIAAVACNDDMRGFCRGHACRPTLAAAADAALMELAQMELGYQLAATKRQVRGEAALNDTDRQHIARYTQVDIADASALHPVAPPPASRDVLAEDRISTLATVRKRLEAAGVDAYAMNLTRSELGIAMTRTFAPALEIGLTAPPGTRLRAAAAASGVDPERPVVL